MYKSERFGAIVPVYRVYLKSLANLHLHWHPSPNQHALQEVLYRIITDSGAHQRPVPHLFFYSPLRDGAIVSCLLKDLIDHPHTFEELVCEVKSLFLFFFIIVMASQRVVDLVSFLNRMELFPIVIFFLNPTDDGGATPSFPS